MPKTIGLTMVPIIKPKLSHALLNIASLSGENNVVDSVIKKSEIIR